MNPYTQLADLLHSVQGLTEAFPDYELPHAPLWVLIKCREAEWNAADQLAVKASAKRGISDTVFYPVIRKARAALDANFEFAINGGEKPANKAAYIAEEELRDMAVLLDSKAATLPEPIAPAPPPDPFAETGLPKSRIEFDKQTLSITLDEKVHKLDAKSYSAVELLHSRIGKVIPGTTIRISVKGLRGKNAITDLVAKLPEPIKACIKSEAGPGGGYEFSLPLIKKKR